MRFRIKSGQSARRFVFDRTPAPAKPPQPSAPRAADLDNPYGRYYGTARSREDLWKNRYAPFAPSARRIAQPGRGSFVFYFCLFTPV